MLKIVVGQNLNDAAEFGYVAGADDNFGACIPDTINGKVIQRITQKADAIEAHVGSQAFGATMTFTTASGATVDLPWDDTSKSYKGTGLADTFKNHFGCCDILEAEAKGAVATTATSDAPSMAPEGFAIPTVSTLTPASAMINWVAPQGGDTVTGYSVAVDQGGTPISGSPFSMAGSTLKKVLTGLTAATTYNVVVTATNGEGSLAATALTVTTA